MMCLFLKLVFTLNRTFTSKIHSLCSYKAHSGMFLMQCIGGNFCSVLLAIFLDEIKNINDLPQYH